MTGSTPSTTKSEYYSDDGLPWVTPTDIESNIISDSPRKLSEEGSKVARVVPANTILCTCIASIGKNALLTVKGSFNQQINSLTPNNENDPYFLLTESEIWSNHMKRMAASGTMQIVNKTEFSELLTMAPKYDEQKKIGEYFCNLDNLITLHQRKLDKLWNTKKSMLVKMFPQNGSLYPEIRFEGFMDAWEQRKLGEIADKVTTKNSGTEYIETLTNSAEFGIISQRDFFDHNVSNMDNIDGYYIVEDDSFVYNPRISTSAPVGPINRNKLGRTGVMSPLYTVFKTHDVDSEYLEWFFKSTRWHAFMKFNGDSGARSDRFSIKDAVFFEMPIPIPDIEEQRKIGKYMTELDNLITLHQRKCEETKTLKKYMLQKMFPKKGEIFPEVRFAGFSEAWEQRKLGEVCGRVTRKNKNGESDLPLTIASQYGLIDQRDFFNKVVAAKDMSNYYLLKKGEFAYNKSYSNGFDYGSIKRLNAYEQGCLSTLYICFGITSDDVESDYLECYFDTLKWYGDVSQICAEGARNHGLLNVDTKAFFDEVTIEMPSSKEEQGAISAYLNNLDNLINLYQCKLEKVKNIKKSMLERMFV